jgi:hypothetical protein
MTSGKARGLTRVIHKGLERNAVDGHVCCVALHFLSRDNIADAVEIIDGPTCLDLAASYGIYIVIDFAERDAATGIFYNAAAAYSPEG